MNSIEFRKKIIEAFGSKHQAVTNQTVDNTAEVIRDFSQELLEDLLNVLNGRVSNETASIVVEILTFLTKKYKQHETMQSLIFSEIYKMTIHMNYEEVTVKTPIFGKEDNNGFMF